MQKSSLCVKLVRLMTKKTLYFYSILFLGVVIFLYLTLTTHIDTAEGSRTLFYMIFFKAGRSL